MAQSKASSFRWKQRQHRDPYVERAAKEGWRSRAVFKLEQIDQRERLLKHGAVCVDLGAAPGGWSQYASRRVGATGRVVAIDLLAMDPIDGVDFIRGDFASPQGLNTLRETLGEQRVDLVLSDMAPNISGNNAIDSPRSIALAEEALLFAEEILKPGGSFLVKLFQGEGFPEFQARVRPKFRKTKLIKPRASRPESREIYLLARQYRM